MTRGIATAAEQAGHSLAPEWRRRSYAMALAAFVAKGLFGFAITYLVANHLPRESFALWATVLSFATVLGVAELGVGQLVLTTFHERRLGAIEPDVLVSDAVAAMAVLAGALFAAITVLFAATDVFAALHWRELLIAVILVRLIAVPYAAYLSALERYHERRLAEALSFAAGAAFIFWGVRAQLDVSVLLLGMSVVVSLGSIGIVMRARQLGMPRVRLELVSLASTRRVLRESFPYFLSNVATLATYGGFIALSALVLPASEVARLALLHSLVLMHSYQVFDLLFKALQPRMNTARVMQRLHRIIGAGYIAAIAFAALAGTWALGMVFRQYAFTRVELILYTTFVFVEVYFLLMTSAMQMRSAVKAALQRLSLIKAGSFGIVLFVAATVSAARTLTGFAALLVVYSAVLALLARGRVGAGASESANPDLAKAVP